MPNRNNAKQTMKRSSVKRQTAKQSKPKRNKQTKKRTEPMSACALAFASAIADPFGTPAGICLPGTFPMPSEKRKDIIRCGLTIGPSGLGFAALRPNGGNDSQALYVTTPTSVITGVALLSTATDLAHFSFNTLPYTNTEINSSQVQWRAVTVGLRIRYIGREDARNGIITTYEVSNHTSALSLTGSIIGSEINASREHPYGDGRWHSVFSSGPKHPNDLDFTSVAPFENPYLVITVSGTAGDRYECECVQHIELIGPVVSSITPSSSDPVGYSRVVNAAQLVSAVEPVSYNTAVQLFNSIAGAVYNNSYRAIVSPLFQRGLNYGVNRSMRYGMNRLMM